MVLLPLLWNLNLIPARAESLDHWVNRLAVCESNRNANAIVLDVNKKYSAGILQFQLNTIKVYALRYGMRSEITREDWLNPDLQRRVAIAMLTESWSNWRHWRNCSIVIGLPPQTDLALRSF